MNTLEKHKTLIAAQQVDYVTLLPLCYRFNYDGLPFECQIVRGDNDNFLTLNLTVLLGYLPYSAENKSRRDMLRSRLGPLLSQGKVDVDRHSKITYPLKTEISADINANIIMEAITYTLLDVRETLMTLKQIIEMPINNEISIEDSQEVSLAVGQGI